MVRNDGAYGDRAKTINIRTIGVLDWRIAPLSANH